MAIRDALANELHRDGPLHPAQARRCANTVLRRLEHYIAALEFYRDANDQQRLEDQGKRAAHVLMAAKPVAPETPPA